MGSRSRKGRGAERCFDCGRKVPSLRDGLCFDCRRDREVYGRDTLDLPELEPCGCDGLESCGKCGGIGFVPVAESEVHDGPA